MTKQDFYKEMFIGTLIYTLVLGFYSDYTNILYTSSFRFVFLAALVMQFLTYPTFQLKKRVAGWFSQRSGFIYKLGLVIGVWSIMFFSKFIFLEVIDFIFGQSVEISGFIGLIVIIVTMLIIDKTNDFIYKKLDF
jgi:hypothetical protein